MDFMDKLIAAMVFWFKWSLLIGFLFFASWFGLGVFDSTYGVLNLRAEGKEVQYWAIISIPVLVGLFWFLWSVTYVPVRHFILGYAFMVETCPSCKTQHGYTDCPNCKGHKFLDDQCMICGYRFEGEDLDCDECGTEGMKFRAERSFEFEENEEGSSVD